MSEKMFISYNHEDSDLVDSIARRIEIEFGRKNIFYDKWSIQPGDSIIGKMNDGLTTFTVFFFFVSKNSLQSKMVTLEWQTALNRAVNNDLKFVAIKLDDCKMPTILIDKLYIDLYNEGLEDAVAKMKSVIQSNDAYRPLEDLKNLNAEIRRISNNSYEISIRAKAYADNSTRVYFACDNNLSNFGLILSGLFISGNCRLPFNGKILNAWWCQSLTGNVKPGFPLYFEVEANENLKDIHLFKLKNFETNELEEIDVSFLK